MQHRKTIPGFDSCLTWKTRKMVYIFIIFILFFYPPFAWATLQHEVLNYLRNGFVYGTVFFSGRLKRNPFFKLSALMYN